MKTIAQNTTASEKVITKIQKGFSLWLYPCDENCEQVDLIYIDNGNTEYFTSIASLRMNDRNDQIISIKNNEMRLRDCNTFLETIELK